MQPFWRRCGRVARLMLSGLMVVVVVGLAACSSAPPSEDAHERAPADSARKGAEAVLGPLRLVKEEYRDAVRNGNVIDTGEYRESRMFAREARRSWKHFRDTAARRLGSESLRQLDRDFDGLVALVEDRGPVQREERMVNRMMTQLKSLGGGKVSPSLQGVVDSIRRADRDIQGERTDNDYRIGLALLDSSNLYRGEKVVSASTGAARQVRVILRQHRTKRPVPGAVVKVRWVDTGGQPVGPSIGPLPEVWGPYPFYGTNVNVPSKASGLRVTVRPSRLGRHADMKGILTRSASAEFGLVRSADGVRAAGPDPTPVAEDYELASDVSMALGEALLFRSAAPYRIGFIAEHAEPFWYPAEQSDTAEELSFRLAQIPEDANRHLEALVLEQGTNRVVPHAQVQLTLEPVNGGDVYRFELPFLMAAFYHYGNSVVLPSGDYRGRITVGRPKLLTLEPGYFPDRRQVSFTWSPDDGAKK